MPQNEPRGELDTHRSYLSDARPSDLVTLKAGDVIRFTYDAEERTVFVLNPKWKEMLHGLDMNAINRRDLMIEVVAKQDAADDPLAFYKIAVSRDAVKESDSYRTYKLKKISNLRKLQYNIDERGREEL